ncbi:MAG: N-acetyltransferase [Acidobacteria bacterium]|nr:N-acetyltransferase [Acidobacteriota bacterium]
MKEVRIRPVVAEDAAAVAGIYNHFVRHTIVTFEEEEVTVKEMARRVERVAARYPWFVGEAEGEVIGYAYADIFKDRSAYRFSVETTIYLRPDATGKGSGRRLYAHLLSALQQRGIVNAVAIIALPNPASVRLHERAGFRRAGRLHGVGWKLGRWLDVEYWQCVLGAPVAGPRLGVDR